MRLAQRWTSARSSAVLGLSRTRTTVSAVGGSSSCGVPPLLAGKIATGHTGRREPTMTTVARARGAYSARCVRCVPYVPQHELQPVSTFARPSEVRTRRITDQRAWRFNFASKRRLITAPIAIETFFARQNQKISKCRPMKPRDFRHAQ